MRVVLDVLKSSIFVVQKLALNQNGVEFYQQSIGDIKIGLGKLHDVVQRRAMESKFLVYIHTQIPTHSQTKLCLEVGTLPKKV